SEAKYNKLKVIREYIKKLSKNNFVKKVLSIKEAGNDKEERLKRFHQIFYKFKLDPFPFFFLSFFADHTHNENDYFKGYFSQFSLSAKGCKSVTWRSFKYSELGLESFMEDWGTQ
ncbi:MAG: hypothetical protein ACI9QD_000675, partial [Thermoproteota archaeon]